MYARLSLPIKRIVIDSKMLCQRQETPLVPKVQDIRVVPILRTESLLSDV